MFSINKVLDNRPGVKNTLLQMIEEEVVGLLEETELPTLLSCDDGRRTATEAAVVDTSYSRLVVGELCSYFGVRNESGAGKLGSLG